MLSSARLALALEGRPEPTAAVVASGGVLDAGADAPVLGGGMPVASWWCVPSEGCAGAAAASVALGLCGGCACGGELPGGLVGCAVRACSAGASLLGEAGLLCGGREGVWSSSRGTEATRSPWAPVSTKVVMTTAATR